MSVTSTTNEAGVVTISIDERFIFDSHVEFRKIYRELPQDSSYIIDLNRTTYMDSSALGMLLLLREHNGMGNTIKITNCGSEIIKVFMIARFDKMFVID